MDEVAADLGISKAALYYYFTTKEELFRQVIAREQLAFVAKVEEVIQKNCAASKKLLLYFEQHVTFLNELLNLKIISSDSSEIIHPTMRDAFKEFSQKETSLLNVIISEGKKNGEFAIESAEKTSLLLEHCIQGLRMRFLKFMKLEPGKETDIQTFVLEIKMFSQIFLRGISH